MSKQIMRSAATKNKASAAICNFFFKTVILKSIVSHCKEYVLLSLSSDDQCAKMQYYQTIFRIRNKVVYHNHYTIILSRHNIKKVRMYINHSVGHVLYNTNQLRVEPIITSTGLYRLCIETVQQMKMEIITNY